MNLTYDVKCTQLILATLASLSQPNGSSNPPQTPLQPVGQSGGIAYHLYSFETSTTDPESDQIYYKWDWGNEIGDWEGPFDSGDTAVSSHYWSTAGTYEIRVKAKDDNGSVESDWSDSKEFDITGRSPLSVSIHGGVGAAASIENIVDVNLDELLWAFSFDGGIILIAEGTTGTIEDLAVGDVVTVETERLFGIGIPKVTFGIDGIEVSTRAILFGPFVLM
jgi:hypothetical protein